MNFFTMVRSLLVIALCTNITGLVASEPTLTETGAAKAPASLDKKCQFAIRLLNANFNPVAPALTKGLQGALKIAAAVLTQVIEDRDDDAVTFAGNLSTALAVKTSDVIECFPARINRKIISIVDEYNKVFSTSPPALSPVQNLRRLTLRSGLSEVDESNPDQELLRACVCGDEKAIEKALRAGANIETTEGLRFDETPLEWLPEMCSFSIEDRGMTPLMLAVLGGHANCVQLLIRECASPLAITPTPYGHTMLHLAAEKGNIEILTYLLTLLPIDSLNQWDETPLFTAILHNQTDCAIFLLESGANRWANKYTEIDDTLLHQAVKHRNFKLIKYLSSDPFFNANVNTMNKMGLTPFASAVLQGDLDCARCLRGYGAHVHAELLHVFLYGLWQDRLAKCSPIEGPKAVAHLYAVLNYLVEELGLSVNARPTDLEMTPSLVFLLNNAILTNDCDLDNHTPLMMAAETGCEHIIKYLLDHGADRTITNSDGLTAEQIAEASGQVEIAELLRTYVPTTPTESIPSAEACTGRGGT